MGLEIWLQGRIVGGRLYIMYGEKYPGIARCPPAVTSVSKV